MEVGGHVDVAEACVRLDMGLGAGCGTGHGAENEIRHGNRTRDWGEDGTRIRLEMVLGMQLG